MIYRFIIFLILNFGALAIGGLYTNKGVSSTWYANLMKAPWTPPGWVFGFAWTTIMLCFSIYMTKSWAQIENKKLLLFLFIIQWILNVLWNPTFFHYQHILLALIVISALTVLIAFILFFYWPALKLHSLWLVPYFIWLLIATSLNAYIWLKN